MNKKLLTVAMLIVVTVLSVFGFAACNKNGSDVTTLRFSAPEGTPALAFAKLITDNKTLSGKNMEYATVSPALIAAEMSGTKSDLVIMPVNAGAKLISDGADYKLVSVAVEGSLYLVGKSDTAKTVSIDDIKGKKIACIGKTGIPGIIFNFVMKGNNIAVTEDKTALTAENVFVQYVADGNAAKALLVNDTVDYAVVGEPAATAFKGAISCKAQMNMQTEYAKLAGNGVTTYPQAGLFVKSALAADEKFMTALFDALAASKKWVTENAADVTAYMQTNAYASAAFPAASIPNCAIDATKLTAAKQAEIVAFLKKIMPAVAWDDAKLF